MLFFEVEGLERVFKALERTVGRAADLRESADEINREFADVEKEQFFSDGASGRSGRWEPLKRATVEAKRRGGIPADPLVRSGRMAAALTNPTDPGRGFRPTQDGIEWSFPFPAGLHQNPKPGSKLPQREVISLTDEQEARLFEPVRRHAEEVRRAEGLG